VPKVTRPRRPARRPEPGREVRLDAPARWRREAALIFAVALVIRLVHIWQLQRAPFFDLLLGDAQSYDAWARRIAAGDWLGHEVFYQAPLYPYFLAVVYSLFGHSLMAVRVVQACIGSAACVLMWATARRLFAPDHATRLEPRRCMTTARIAGLGLAMYAPAIFFDALIQKTVLDVFLVCLTLLLLARLLDAPDRSQRWLALGATLGALSLTRENALVLIAVFVWWAVVLRPPHLSLVVLRRLLPFAAGLAVVLAPIGIRNSVIGGGFYITTSQFGPNLYLGNNPHADGMAGSLRAGRGSPEYERQDATELAEFAAGRPLTPGEVSSYWTAESLAWIRANPGAWLKLTWRKLELLINRAEVLDTESQESHAEWSWLLRLLGWVANWGVLLPLAAVGVFVTREQADHLRVLYAMAAVYGATMLVFYVYARYRYPLVPLLMLFAAAAIDSMWRGGSSWWAAYAHDDGHSSTRILRRTVAPLAIAASIAVFANLPVLSADAMRAMTEHNLGAAMQSNARLDEAIDHYRRALQLKPDDAATLSNLGAVFAAKGDPRAAIESYRRALAIDDSFPDAHYNLANALLRQGQAAEAVEHFRRALQGSRGSADVHVNLGLALLEQGSIDQGLGELRQAAALSNDSADVQHTVGNALASHGRLSEGLDHLRRAAELAPGSVDVRFDYATALLENGRAADAVPQLEAALRANPSMVEARNNLGLALASLGRTDEAIGHFQEALRLQPDFMDARRNLQLAVAARDRATVLRSR
jgi:tetratricopeptide (TPR) repeat protein